MIVWIIFGSLGCESSKCHHTQYFEDNAACRADRKLACCKHCPQQSRKARYRLHDAFGHNSCESTWVTLQRCNSGCFVRGLSERRMGYYGQANKLSAEGSLEGRESNPEFALCLPHRDLIRIKYADELQFSADTISWRVSLFPAGPLTPGRGFGGVGWLE